MSKFKVCIVCKSTVTKDQRTLTEAKLLAENGLEVIVVGLLGKAQSLYEMRVGFSIRRVASTFGLASGFRDRLYYPIIGRLPRQWKSKAQILYRFFSSLLKWIDRKTKRIAIFIHLGSAMFAEKSAFYHAHFPAWLMLLSFLVAKVRRSRFIADYNDIIILEGRKRGKQYFDYYAQESLWGKSLTKREQARIDSTIQAVPEDVNTILDVGCGDGRLINEMTGNNVHFIGLDISEAALQYVKIDKVKASGDQLPFGDRSFDLVLSTELIEHLPDKIYRTAITEMKRVSDKWIIIGVPWREQLKIAQARCIRCGSIFHVNYHFRNFQMSGLKDLFKPEYEFIMHEFVGSERAYYVSSLLWLKRRLGGVWTRTSHTICPTCKTFLYPGGYPERNAVTKFCDERNEKAKRRRRLEKSHVVALYRKNDFAEA